MPTIGPSSTGSGSSLGGTTTAIDTTGMTLIVIGISYWQGVNSITDTFGNPYTKLTAVLGGIINVQLAYRLNPTVGAGHVITINSSGNGFPAIMVQTWSGTAGYAFHTSASYGQNSSLGPPIATTPITPPNSNAIIATAFGTGNGTLPTALAIAPSGFTRVDKDGVGGINFPGAFGSLIQSVAAPIAPSWSWTGGFYDVATQMLVISPPAPPPTESRITQAITEIISLQGTPEARVSQQLTEILIPYGIPAARISQIAVEVLTSSTIVTREKIQFFLLG